METKLKTVYSSYWQNFLKLILKCGHFVLLLGFVAVSLTACSQKKNIESTESKTNPSIFAEIIGTWTTNCTVESDGTYSQQLMIFGEGTVNLTTLKQASTSACSDGYRLITEGTMAYGAKTTNGTGLNFIFQTFAIVPDSTDAVLTLKSTGTDGDNIVVVPPSNGLPGSGIPGVPSAPSAPDAPSSGSQEVVQGACSIRTWNQNQEENVTNVDCTNLGFSTAPYALYTIFLKDSAGLKMGVTSTGKDGLTSAKRYSEIGTSIFTLQP